MGWQSGQRRWIKKHCGKQYVVSCRQLGVDPTREASRAAANDWWRTKKAELEQSRFEASGSERALSRLAESLEFSADIAERNGNLPQLAAVKTERAIVSRFADSKTELRADHADTLLAGLYDPLPSESAAETERLDRLAILESRRSRQLAAIAAKSRTNGQAIELTALQPVKRRKTLRESVDAFLAEKLSEVTRKKLSAGRYGVLDSAVRAFAAWIAENASAHDCPASVEFGILPVGR
jgi:hypothetical protein